MPASYILNSPEELTQAAISVLAGKINPENMTLAKDYSIRIKIADPTWTYRNKIDYKIAGLVLDIQKDILGMYSSISGTKIDLRNLHKFDKKFIIKVEVKDGCVEAVVKLAGFFEAVIKNMTGKQQVAAISIICATLALGGSAWFAHSYLNHVEDIKAKIEDEKTKQKLGESLKEVAIALANNKDTPKHIASRTSYDAVIEFGGGEKFTKDELQKAIKEQNQEDERRQQNFTIDAKYDVPSYNYEDQTARLRINGFEFDASTKSLSEDVKRDIQRDANEADLKGTFARVNLQVIANVRGNKLVDSYIIGVGVPRAGSVAITDVLSIKNKDKSLNSSQGSLLEYTRKE
ncbi:hypothetical protein [Desulfovibrio sp. DV]|uniref:hypothetical protein n=1 Tax=Desulfovibrio sp. DV TaxID=1844708 RepID=UPI000AE8D26B|nr:hypothetical protein [Desulfovibrio sp. DV]